MKDVNPNEQPPEDIPPALQNATNSPDSTGATEDTGQVSSVTSQSIYPIESSKTEAMEVHSHGHVHEQKKWKEYVFQFFMLFLAVFCGFLAEYQLEQTIERHREKEYIISMIEDAKADTAAIQYALKQNKRRIAGLDSLVTTCYTFEPTDSTAKQLYYLNRRYVYAPDVVALSERTMSQLKNAGGMRLIRSRASADTIMLYDQQGKKLVNQQKWYEDQLNDVRGISSQVFNGMYYAIDIETGRMKVPPQMNKEMRLLTNDKNTIIQLGNGMQRMEGIIHYYNVLLQETNKKAISVIETLKQQYDIE
jgi:hypothetical protein